MVHIMKEKQSTLGLKAKSLVAVMWSGLDFGSRQIVQLIIAIFLARILSPKEFGIMALLYLFVGVANVFIDSGFSSALIQKKHTTHQDLTTVFWINLFAGVFVSILFWVVAPLFAQFYGYPILIPLTRVLSISLVFNALGAIQSTLFTKHLDFKTPMIIRLTATLLSGALAIFLAIKGFGVWSLAIQACSFSIITTSLLWLTSSWRPSFSFSTKSMKNLFKFGGYLFSSALLDVCYTRFYSLLIGRIYSVQDLAYFTRADNTQQIPVNILAQTFSRVIFPLFSSVADDKEKLLQGSRIALRAIMLINIPMMLGLAVTSETVILILFGDQWLLAAPILNVLCLAGIFWPLHVINLEILKATGHSNLFFKLEIIKKILGFSLLFASLPFGTIGIAWSLVISGFLSFIINAFYTGKLLNFGPMLQAYEIAPTTYVALFMAVVVHCLGNVFSVATIYTLAAQVITGVLVFLSLCIIFKIYSFTSTVEHLHLNKYLHSKTKQNNP